MIQSLLLSTACLVSAPEPASAPRPEMQPHATILAGVKAARRNELARFLSLTLSQAQFKELEREWEKQRREPVNDAEDAQFQQTMAMLTAPGAEDQIMAMIKPKLDEMRPNMAMMVGMITGMAQSSIEQNAGLGAEEKAQARKIVAGMTAEDVQEILGDPDDRNQYLTVKAWIPFYTGADAQKIDWMYAGEGRVVFSMNVRTGTLEVLDVRYDPDELR